jgi:predicted ATPase/class 3 adenylate cyclase
MGAARRAPLETDLNHWLSAVGLDSLVEILRSHDVDLEILGDLTDPELEKIGVSLGLRKKLRKALDERERLAKSGNLALPLAKGIAERRQLTVVFFDLVGSTALSVQLDPEELREILRTYRGSIAAVVQRFDGHIAQHLGDGVLAYFGWPRSHEHQAERAVRAGFAALEAIKALSARGGVTLSGRIGIATGLVVVGEQAAHDETAVGETPNLAARLQGAATPGSIVIEQTTRHLLGNLFEYEPLSDFALKGFANHIRAYKVLGESRVENRFEAFHSSALTPLVGREEEMQMLLQRWERAKSGTGQLVVLSGEAGIGKSRLVATLVRRIHDEPHTELRYFCSPHHRDSALHPIASQLERAAAFERDDAPAVKLDKLEALFEPGPNALEDRHLVAELLRLPDIGRYPPLQLTPQQRKQKTFDALLRQLALLTARRPVLEVFEDVHWIDPTSQDALDRTIDRIRELPVLLIVTCRPEFVPPWVGQPGVTMMNLSRLDRRDGIALIRQVVGSERLSNDVIMGIAERTDGVPLFAEELTKAVLEAGDRGDHATRALTPAPVNTVPAVLYSSLMARLDRLGSAKDVAQISAAIGRECSYELLAAVSDLGEESLLEAIGKLTASGLMIARGSPPDSAYLFKHALVQDAAYGTMLISRRQQLHGRIAELIESRFPDRAAREPELLARHFAEAKLSERAIPYWIKAGRHAAERSANLEAIRHLSQALEAMPLLPESEARDRQELVGQTALGTSLISVHGYAAPQTGAAYTRARQLSQRLGDRDGLYATLGGEFSYYFVRADQSMMRHLTQEAKTIADDLADDSLRQVERRLIGLSGMHFGEFATARVALEAIVSSYDPSQHRPPPVHYVHDPKIYALAYLAVILWIQGYPDQARRWSAATMAYTAELNNANMTAFAHVYGGAGLQELLRDPDGARPHVDAIMKLAEHHTLHYFKLSGIALQGWLEALGGDAAQGIALMQGSIEERAALAVGWYQTRYLCMVAEVCLQNGDGRAGMQFITRAKQHIAAHDEHMWEAEVLRLEGELLRLEGAADAAVERCFLESIGTAGRQGAKSFELRAAMGLAGHWRDRGRRSEAREALAPVLAWFTEGLDTADLRQARQLLEELCASR